MIKFPITGITSSVKINKIRIRYAVTAVLTVSVINNLRRTQMGNRDKPKKETKKPKKEKLPVK